MYPSSGSTLLHLTLMCYLKYGSFRRSPYPSFGYESPEFSQTHSADLLIAGEKVVPAFQEDYLNAVPMVSSAIMFGRGQSQPGVIIEPMADYAIDPADENALIDFRNKLWYVSLQTQCI